MEKKHFRLSILNIPEPSVFTSSILVYLTNRQTRRECYKTFLFIFA